MTSVVAAEVLARGPDLTPVDPGGPDWLLVDVFVVAAAVIVLGAVYVLGGRTPTREIRADELQPGMTLLRVPDEDGRCLSGERVVSVTPSREPGGAAILVRVRWRPRWVWTLDPAEPVEIKARPRT
jgi:hypothetical protein